MAPEFGVRPLAGGAPQRYAFGDSTFEDPRKDAVSA
jgi:hypothetical protein